MFSFFKSARSMQRHLRTCSVFNQPKFRRNCVVRPLETMFEKLERHGVRGVPTIEDPLIACFDFEARLKEIDVTAGQTELYQAHIPMACAIYAEIHDPDMPAPDSYEATYFCDADDVTQLITDFLDHLETLSNWAYKTNKNRYASIFKSLENRVDWAIRLLDTSTTDEDRKRAQRVLDAAANLQWEWDSYCRQLPVIGFNRYITV